MPFTSRELVDEIEQRVLEQGVLTKAQIVSGWELQDDGAYALLRDALLARGRVEPGPRRVGGFQAKRQRDTLPPEMEARLLLESWESTVTERLAGLLQHKELEDLLGGLAYTVRESRRLDTGESRSGTKAELAAALVIQHGDDLLAEPRIRETVARTLKVDHPKKWHPGKASAVEFVERIGFPSRLAGLPRDEALPDFEYLGTTRFPSSRTSSKRFTGSSRKSFMPGRERS